MFRIREYHLRHDIEQHQRTNKITKEQSKFCPVLVWQMFHFNYKISIRVFQINSPYVHVILLKTNINTFHNKATTEVQKFYHFKWISHEISFLLGRLAVHCVQALVRGRQLDVIRFHPPDILCILGDCSVAWEFSRWCNVEDTHLCPFQRILKKKTKRFYFVSTKKSTNDQTLCWCYEVYSYLVNFFF